MGEPEYLNAKQVAQLQESSQLIREPIDCKYKNYEVSFKLKMPPHSIAAVTIEFDKEIGTGRK